jgi:hypothetical protein
LPSPRKLTELWFEVNLLLGLNFPVDVARGFLTGVRNMQESSTFQAVINEGRVEGRVEGRISEGRRMLFLVGRKRFGEPSTVVREAIETIDEPEKIETLVNRLFEVESWDHLLPA